MALEDVYNMDETGLCSHAQTNKTLVSAGKSLWMQNLEGPSHSCSCYKHKFQLVKIYKYAQLLSIFL